MGETASQPSPSSRSAQQYLNNKRQQRQARQQQQELPSHPPSSHPPTFAMPLFARANQADAEKAVAKPIPHTTSSIEMAQRPNNLGHLHENSNHSSTSTRHRFFPAYTHRHSPAGHPVTRGIAPEGESGRSWIHPWHFVRISMRSSCTASKYLNLLWPVVPAALAVRYARPDLKLLIFILSYIAMVPSANLVGFAGQEFSRKLPRVFGVLVETTMGSIVEIVLFLVLLSQGQYMVIQAAILGSILATMLLCLGMCFFVGGMRHEEQTFDDAISEVGNGLLLIAGLGLLIPTAFYAALHESAMPEEELLSAVLKISRITAILLIISYGFYVWYNMRTHHTIYDAIFLADEHADTDRHIDIYRDKLTFTESILALAISIALVTLFAIQLVSQIHYIVETHHVSDLFMGLILVPLVEKIAEHITAVDEAYDNTMNTAMAHVLGATIQTALFNGPLAVIVGWIIKKDLSLNFDLFTIIVVILSIIVVGNFLKDKKSNYLEGALCVIAYIIISVAAYYYPNLHLKSGEH